MPRTRNIYHTEFPYHITARTNDALPYPCEMSEAWEIYKNALWFYSRIFKTRILSFVMMNNHFHLLMVTPEGNLSDFMKFFMKKTSDDIRALRQVKNHLYGDRYYACLVSNQNYFQTVLKYIYQNPVRAKICDSVLEYPYSTLPSFLGRGKLEIPVFDDFHFYDNLDANLRWLDESFDVDSSERVKKALKLQEFKPERNSSSYFDDTLIKNQLH